MTLAKQTTKNSMKYVVTPLNEGQEMNCRVKVNGTLSQTVKRALGMAANLQAQLDGNVITCRVRRAGRGWEITDRDGVSIIVTPVGQVFDEHSGIPAKL